MGSATHELCFFENGTVSLRHIGFGEAMHSSIGPQNEAAILYLDQSDFPARLACEGRPLVVFDLGMGIATNSLGALAQAEAFAARPIEIHSFESDLSGAWLALQSADCFSWLTPTASQRLKTLLETGRWSSFDGRLRWVLHEGDFKHITLPDAAPELLYFDFYSSKAQPDLWSEAVFRKLCRVSAEHSVLLTYSASTRVRVALLLAGFFVGRGCSTAAKSETTVAARCLSDVSNPLGAPWLEKLRRSHLPEANSWLHRLGSHPQFISLSSSTGGSCEASPEPGPLRPSSG